MGFFTGLFGWAFDQPKPVPVKPYLPYNNNFVGHVLDVILDEDHPLYDVEKNQIVGTIFWRDALRSGEGGSSPTEFDETSTARTANPIDRSTFKLPLPGEQVTIYRAKSSRLDGPDIFLTSKFFYDKIIGMTANNVINSAPFIGINPERINPLLPGARTVSELAKRFDKKIKNLAMFKTGNKPVARKQVQVNEGDFLLQGRSGGSIRFTATPTPSQVRGQKWAEDGSGPIGDPIVLMRVGKSEKIAFDDINKPDTLFETEDFENDAASIYLTTTQKVGVTLAIPDKGELAHPLATWAYDFGVSSLASDKKGKAKAKDGEAARSGGNQVAPKQAADASEAQESTSATNQNGEQNQPPTTENEGYYNHNTGEVGQN